MPPASDGIRTVGCSLVKLIPDEGHLAAIRRGVLSVHAATILATELLNMHLRRCLLGETDTPLECFFNGSWILNAYNEVTVGKRETKTVDALRATKEQCMPPFSAPDRTGIQQCILYDARNLATVAATGVWMHFQKRILSHVRSAHALSDLEYAALSVEERRTRKLSLMQMAADVCKHPSDAYQSPLEKRAWVAQERRRLGIDDAVGDWGSKPLLYHLKACPQRFLPCMYLLSKEREARGGAPFSLYPLRRSLVPKHVRFDQKALRDLLHTGSSEHIKQLARKRAKKRKASDMEAATPLPPLQKDGTGVEAAADGRQSVRRTREEMKAENEELFGNIVDLRAANVQRRHRFDFAFTTHC